MSRERDVSGSVLLLKDISQCQITQTYLYAYTVVSIRICVHVYVYGYFYACGMVLVETREGGGDKHQKIESHLCLTCVPSVSVYTHISVYTRIYARMYMYLQVSK